VALCGIGGAGKTSVAVEYAHGHLAEGGVCYQFDAEDPEVLAAEFGVLAAQMGAGEKESNRVGGRVMWETALGRA
jgi:predicted ATPase